MRSGLGGKPGPNNWSNSDDNVSIDEAGQLHLRIMNRNGKWYCSELNNLQALGYGRYEFYLASRIDLIDKNVVAGLFVYQDDSNEIDIEFSRWGELTTNTQYVVQPGPYTNRNLHRFNMQLDGNYSTHSFEWAKDSIAFQSSNGSYDESPNSHYLIAKWSYRGKNIPIPGRARLVINFWLFHESSPSNGIGAELVLRKFQFTPWTRSEG